MFNGKHTEETKQKMRDSHPKRPIIAIDMKTKNTRTYESTRAAGADGFASSNITAACKGRLRHCYGFYWRYLDEFESIEKVFEDAKNAPHKNSRPVVAIDPKRKTTKQYPSIRAAAAEGLNYDSVIAALLGRSRRCGGKFWRYAEDFKDIEQVLKEENEYESKEKAS